MAARVGQGVTEELLDGAGFIANAGTGALVHWVSASAVAGQCIVDWSILSCPVPIVMSR